MKEYNPFEDRKFRVDKLEKNEITVRGKSYAKLPKMPGRVFMRDSVPEGVTLTQDLENDDVAFLADRCVDDETGENHDEVVVIGKDISFFLDGMMLVGEHYHEYFDINGRLVVDPMQRHRREGKRDARRDRETREGNKTIVPSADVSTGVEEQLEEILKRKNRTRLGESVIVRVPEIPGRIARVHKDQDTEYIQLIYKAWKDPKTGKNRNKKTVIGKMVEYNVNAMYPNKQYEQFFDMDTGELKHPLDDSLAEEPDRKDRAVEKKRDENDDGISDEQIEKELKKIIREADERYREEKRSKLQRAEEEERKRIRKEMMDEDDEFEDEEMKEAEAYVEHLAEEIRREEAKSGQGTEKRDGEAAEDEDWDEEELRQKETELNETYAGMNREKERVTILKLILRGVHESIRIQARKRPDDIVNSYKAETMNSLLEEAKGYYAGTGYGDLLKLIPKPVERVLKDGSVLMSGLTYSDVDVLLSHYDTILRFIDADIKDR